MVLEVCGESISIPNGIADWCRENPDNRVEFDGMIESMIWAIQKKYKPKQDTNKSTNSEDLTKDLINFWKALFSETPK